MRRSAAIALAAGAQINDEATILINAANEAATDDARTRAALADIRASAQRCVWLAKALLRYGSINSGRACASTVERLAEGPML